MPAHAPLLALSGRSGGHVEAAARSQVVLQFALDLRAAFVGFGRPGDGVLLFAVVQLAGGAGGGQFVQHLAAVKLTDSGRFDRVGHFAAPGSLPKKLSGRGDYLLKSTTSALEFLARKRNPFFLLVEAADIDSGGHSNNTSMIISEMVDFDEVIGAVIRFADENPGTLVLITADHETGGVSIPQGDLKSNTVELAYHSDDHTGIMVPIFAYGTQADEFRGVYENTQVFHKIMKLLNN